jgi:hypothetical protein
MQLPPAVRTRGLDGQRREPVGSKRWLAAVRLFRRAARPLGGAARLLSGHAFDLSRWRAEHAVYAYVALRLFTVIALTYAGLVALYVPNVTFGSSGLVDYGSLLLWGIGSDIASKTLSNVPAMIPKR